MEEVMVDTIEIDNKEYIILDKLTNNNNTYYYLSNANDPKDFFIQKLDNQKENLIPLDSKEEFNIAMEIYSKKYN